MLPNHDLSKSISDVDWRVMVNATQSKAAYVGSEVALAYPMNMSQMFSRYGLIVRKDLSDRIHNCPGHIYGQGSKRSHKHTQVRIAIYLRRDPWKPCTLGRRAVTTQGEVSDGVYRRGSFAYVSFVISDRCYYWGYPSRGGVMNEYYR